MKTMTLGVRKGVNQFVKLESGDTVLIKDISGNTVATATESPSGQYIATFTERDTYGYWWVNGVQQTGYGTNSPFKLCAYDRVLASTVSSSGGFFLNGNNINTAGTLNNVAYVNDDNTFTNTQRITTDIEGDAVFSAGQNSSPHLRVGVRAGDGLAILTLTNDALEDLNNEFISHDCANDITKIQQSTEFYKNGIIKTTDIKATHITASIISASNSITASAIKLTTSPVNGYVLTSNANGNATWQPVGASSNYWTASGANISRNSDIIVTGAISASTFIAPLDLTLSANNGFNYVALADDGMRISVNSVESLVITDTNLSAKTITLETSPVTDSYLAGDSSGNGTWISTSSLKPTSASYASTSTSASFANSAASLNGFTQTNYVLNSQTSSMKVLSSSYASGSTSASFATTASYALNAGASTTQWTASGNNLGRYSDISITGSLLISASKGSGQLVLGTTLLPTTSASNYIFIQNSYTQNPLLANTLPTSSAKNYGLGFYGGSAAADTGTAGIITIGYSDGLNKDLIIGTVNPNGSINGIFSLNTLGQFTLSGSVNAGSFTCSGTGSFGTVISLADVLCDNGGTSGKLIGCTQPSGNLYLQSTTNTAQGKIIFGTSNVYNVSDPFYTASQFYFQTGSITKPAVIFDNSNTVGIFASGSRKDLTFVSGGVEIVKFSGDQSVLKLTAYNTNTGSAITELSTVTANDYPTELTYQARLTTTDGGTAAFNTIQTIPTVTDTTYLIETRIVGQKISGGGTATSVGYVMQIGVKNIGGTVTTTGTLNKNAFESNTNADATIDVSGTNIIVQVKGTINNTVVWNATTRIYRISV